MAKTLIVVESPHKGKQIQKFLGDNLYIVRASAGHIADLVKTKENKFGIDIVNGFKPKYEALPEKADKVKAIIDAASLCDNILLASDPDREGESISFHLKFAIEKRFPNKPIKRVKFHEITKKGIQKGIDNPMELDQKVFDAQQARRVLDRLVGFMVSPFLIDLLGPNLSAGRVQSVAVRIIIDREREIENFVADEYWYIASTLANENSLKEKFIARFNGPKVTNKDDATKIKLELDKDTYKVIDVIAEEKPKKPLPPLETATLQQVASKKYKISSKKTMECAQSLYEKGLITYHRTDSTRSSPESVSSLRDWLVKHNHDLPDKVNVYAAKGDAQDAHEAIRPTDIENTPDKVNLDSDEKAIYNLIWERFVASQMKPALYDTVSATIKSSSGHILKANGRTLKYKGWLNLIEVKDDEEENKLPQLNVGDTLVLVAPKVKCEQKFTQPPQRYKDHSLIEELKSNGIGRPSTYATILTKITDRSYVEKKKDVFFATDLGKKVVDLLVKHFDFMQYEYTADMEKKLDDIAEGKLDYLGMMNGFFPGFKDQLKKASFATEKDYGIQCYTCKANMRLKHGKFGYYLICNNSPECKTTISCDVVDEKPVVKLKKIEAVEGLKCKKCNGESGMALRQGKFGPFYSCIDPKCAATAKVPYGKKCPDCGYDLYATIFKGESVLFCTGYPNCYYREVLEEQLPDPNKITLNLSHTNKLVNKIEKKLKG